MSYLVFGVGISGISATTLLLQAGEKVSVYEGDAKKNIADIQQMFDGKKPDNIFIGTIADEELDSIHTCVISPGISLDNPFVVRIKNKGIQVIGEIELGYHFAKGTLVAITGTNGKTTTTTLLGEIVKEYTKNAFVVGNIGKPYAAVAKDMTENSITVAEISSFMLETIDQFHPHISAILNISPEHLDRHKTLENYIEAKEKITLNQTKEDVCVLNYEDVVLREFAKNAKPRVVFFSARRKLEEGIYIFEEKIYYAHKGLNVMIMDVNETTLLGEHNYENICAAIAMAIALKIPLETIKDVVGKFKAVEHRIEFVVTKHGVSYYNDSKGTNPDSAIKAIMSMPAKTVLIAGGYDKEADYNEWIRSFDNKVKRLLLLGQTKEKIAKCAEENGFYHYEFVEDLEDAVKKSAIYAQNGEYVLLSPACASWGMFKNFEERGRLFKKYVNELV